jgi:peptidyl-prolyl cis-trans isomerase D
MLQSIRDRLHGPLAYVVLGPIVLVFVAWGAYGIVNLNVGSSNYAAEANGTKISLEQARNAWLRQQSQWQQRFGGAEIPAPLRTRLQDQVLEGMIRGALLTQRTHDLGYRVSRAELRDAIQNEPAFQINGRYDPDAARAALAQAGISLDTFEQELRSDAQRQQLQGGIRASDFLTAAELKRVDDLEGQEREVRYFVLPLERFKSAARVDDAAVQAYYKSHESQFMTPESVHLQYAELRLDALAAQQQVSDTDLRAAYEKNSARLAIPERRHGRHILVTGKDDAAALAQAQQVLGEAKAGKDFGELAKKYSQDPGSARSGGDLGWTERGTLDKTFADALFSMKPGEVRGPVKTQYGYHIIKLEEIQAGRGKSFEEARPELEAQLRKDRATDRFGDVQEKLQSKIAEPGADISALAQQYNLQQGDIASYAKGAGAPPLGAAPPLQDLLFGEPPLAVGHVGGPVLLGDDRLAIVKVLEHRKPQTKPLSEVRAGIVEAITKEEGTQAALAAAEAARARLAGGAPLDAVVGELKVSAEPAHFVGRRDPSIPSQVRDAAFGTPRPAGKPEFRALALTGGGAAVLEVSAVRSAPQPQEAGQPSRARQEAERLGSADAQAYVEELRRTADVRKNPNAFE